MAPLEEQARVVVDRETRGASNVDLFPSPISKSTYRRQATHMTSHEQNKCPKEAKILRTVGFEPTRVSPLRNIHVV